MTHDDVQRWIDAYLDAWRSYDPEAIGALFAEDVTYRYQPYRPPFEGRAAVVETWLDDKDAPGSWTASLEPFAVDGDRAAVVGTCRYLEPDGSQRTVFFNAWLIPPNISSVSAFNCSGRLRVRVATPFLVW